MEEQKARKVLYDGLKLVEKLNEEKPASSLVLTGFSYEDYILKAKKEEHVRNSVLHHVELLKFLSKAVAEEITEDEESRTAVSNFIVNAQGNIPPLGFVSRQVGLDMKAFKPLIASQGKEEAKQLLEKFLKECQGLEKPFSESKKKFLQEKYPGRTVFPNTHEVHLTYHALSGMLTVALKAMKEIREMKGK